MGNCLRLGISRIGLAWTKRRMKTSNKKNSISLLMLGTQAVGKTTIALRLWKFKRSLPDLNYVQTKGFNTYAIRRKNKSSINLYDLGGHPSIQELWDHYYADAHGIIFVVDVSSPESLSEAAVVFSKVVNDERVRGKPILLLANKQDLGGASEVELDSVMNLQEVVNAARCLTRLDESAATDLKNDKGIFDGFRWLVSHITNHYHELNDRVMHDILEEKNREKARKNAIKEQMEQSQSSTMPSNTNLHSEQDRPSSQKSLVSKTFIRDESSVDLQQQARNNECESQSQKYVQPGARSMAVQGSKPNKLGSIPHPTPPLTNYLIKSRPNSSLGESNNPFLLPRNASTAPSTKRRSLPILQPLSGKNNLTLVPGNRFFTNATATQSNGSVDPFVVTNNMPNPSETSTFPSVPITMPSGRLSPEGANSESADSADEGVINHGFDDKTENFHDRGKSDSHQQNVNISATDAQNIPKMPSVTDVSPTGSVIDVTSPERFRKLVRTESSDTERAGEILMVTTLAQVHISNGRRGSTTSTHDSVALSLSSIKSEDTNFMEGWGREAEEDVTHPQSQSRNQNRGTPFQSQKGGANVVTVPKNTVPTTTSAPKQNISYVEKEKAVKSGIMRVGIGKNKTNPMPPGMTMTTSQSYSGGVGRHSATRLPRVTATPPAPATSIRNPVVTLSSKRSRENVFILGPTHTGGPKTKLKNRNLSGFPESLEISSSVSQFTRNRTPLTPAEGAQPSLQDSGPRD